MPYLWAYRRGGLYVTRQSWNDGLRTWPDLTAAAWHMSRSIIDI